MAYPVGAVERAMKVQEVILRALSGQLTWPQAADILGRSPRSIRRLRWRFEHYGYDGLLDRRRQTPSPKRAPVAEVERLLHLYRAHYQGFNVRHFLRKARRDHGVPFCYAFVKKALQGAGLVPKHRARGRHRRRREPRPCFGELLHLDGSRHQWLALVPEQWLTLLTVVDDATTQVLYAQLSERGESTATVMTALRTVFTTWGLPGALYTDRAHWAAHTPVAGGAVDRTKLTQVGRALAQLGIEHILGYSPQARGRSERMNGTLQGRLVDELRVARITTVAAANRYLRERFLPDFNAEFSRASAESTPAFVPLGAVDLEQILCHQDERVVGRDNTVVLDGIVMQLAKQPGRRSCAELRVLVRRHLDGQHSVWHGARRLGLFDARGRVVTPAAA
ncbi:MAG TPA: ISNCY family transposase [Methylomirabilota bacterium]|nr:ISNCY family transposase [Methylomirabilota bacterium]